MEKKLSKEDIKKLKATKEALVKEGEHIKKESDDTL